MVLAILLASRLLAGPSEAADSPPDVAPGPTTAPVPYLSAEDAIKTMKLPPGFHVEVVAAEPLVEHPVAMTFDADGRIWVVEMQGYMPDPQGAGERQPVGRVSILEDVDGDGRVDKNTVFMDHLDLPHAIAVVRDGALLDSPPKLLFCRDTNGDGRADEQTVLANDYGGLVNNPENWPNGLLRDIDNWIYSSSYDKRFRCVDGKWISDLVPEVGQFGITQDDFGRLYHNANSDHLRGSPVPLQYVDRNPNHRGSGGNEQIAYDQTVWPSHGTAVNRGYLPNFLRDDGTLRNFTAACGPVIYRGGAFPPDFAGNTFVCEPSANLIRRDLIFEMDGVVSAENAYDEGEFLTSTYERFRPVNLSNGPDGALYVVDMHHGLLQHRTHLTTYAKNQYLQRDLEKYLHTGRIYRVVANGVKRIDRPHLSNAASGQLVGYLSNPNGWWRDTAQRLLVERGDYRVAPALRKLATSCEKPLGRLHALWTLEGIRQLDVPTLTKALNDPEPKIRAAAIRLSETILASPMQSQLLRAVLKLADDHQPDVRLQFALTISTLGTPHTDEALAKILNDSAGLPYVRDAVLTGLRGRELEFLARLLASDDWSDASPDRTAVLTVLAKCVLNEGTPRRVTELLEAVARQAPELCWRQVAMLNGFPEQPKNAQARRPRVIMLESEPAALIGLKSNDATKEQLAKALAVVHWPGQPGYAPPPPPKALSTTQQARFDAGKIVYTATCMQCHKQTGLGQEGLAPPLLDSEWALGPESRLVRIVLHGLRGPVTVSGESYILDMPALSALHDDEIAAVLTYVRRSWDHQADPVEPGSVSKIRAEESARSMPWTERELLKVR